MKFMTCQTFFYNLLSIVHLVILTSSLPNLHVISGSRNFFEQKKCSQIKTWPLSLPLGLYGIGLFLSTLTICRRNQKLGIKVKIKLKNSNKGYKPWTILFICRMILTLGFFFFFFFFFFFLNQWIFPLIFIG